MIELSVTCPDLARINSRLQLLGAVLDRLAGRGYLIGPTVDYGGFVTNGTRAHMIYPRNARALYWAGASHPVRSVNHPGTKPNPYLTEGLMQAAPQATSAVIKTLADTLDGATTTEDALEAGAKVIRAAVYAAAPVRSGNLRQSLHTEAR